MLATIAVYDAKGSQIASLEVDENWSPTTTGRKVMGRNEQLFGWLGRALEDARAINAGFDPIRPSERAMAMVAARRKPKDADLLA